MSEMKKFESGATRSVEGGRPSYVRALSPIVLKMYVEYLGRHRKQADGTMRDWDNWKGGMPKARYLDGLGRHNMNVWLLMHGFSAEDNHGPVTLENSLYGVMFNSMGMLHELLKGEIENDTDSVS